MLGHIDYIDGEYIEGWFDHNEHTLEPLISLGDIVLTNEVIWLERKDVCNYLKKDGVFGFKIKINRSLNEVEVASLSAVSKDSIEIIHEIPINYSFNSPSKVCQLDLLKEIASDPDSVAITVWEGKHNPIGRAKVLYDIVSSKRKSCIIAFDFGFSESEIWEPLINSNIPVVLIKWSERFKFKDFVQRNGISFNTIWACKNRYPTVELANILKHDDSAIILDIDDNEEHMSSSKAARTKPYGVLANSRISSFEKNVRSISTASISLQEKFGGDIVRHARKKYKNPRKPFSTDGEIKVGFIGTIRPHKGVLEAAKAIAELRSELKLNIKFYVGGMFLPSTLEDEFLNLGGVSIGQVQLEKLHDEINLFDIVITGFPVDASNAITKYQISSKIGDGLTCSKPVLVPYSESVKDLEKIEGIYLFDTSNFKVKIAEIIEKKPSVSLPSDFTLEESYERFATLEANYGNRNVDKKVLIQKEKIVLLWKQCDAGMYGRRVDIVARDLKKLNPNKEVIILEIAHKEDIKNFKKQELDPVSDAGKLLNLISKKREGIYINNVYYKCITIDNFDHLEAEFNNFLITHDILPSCSKFIIYPLTPGFSKLIPCLDRYTVVMDAVDNQISWAKSDEDKIKVLKQYKALAQLSSNIVFNSKNNMDSFINLKICSQDDSKLIENWYSQPQEVVSYSFYRDSKKLTLVYSGNLNDRIDWHLFDRIAKHFKDSIELFIIGNASRARSKIEGVCTNSNVSYLGALEESECLSILKNCDLAIMPHTTDGVSFFMNPLKVKMYGSLGLNCISTNVPGLNGDKNLIVAKSASEFIAKISDIITGKMKLNKNLISETSDLSQAEKLNQLL